MARPSRTARLSRRVGARLRELRVEAELTQEKLAWECDLSKPYLSQIEAGKRLPSLPALDALAQRLHVDLVDVLAVDPDSNRHKLIEAVRRVDKKGVRELLRQMGLV